MKNTFFIILLILNLKLLGQNQTTTTGGTAKGTGGTATYTIGLPLYTNQASSGITILQGVQQPKEFLTISYQKVDILKEVKIFPNPAETFIYIQLEAISLNELKYKLTTPDGKTIIEQNFDKTLTLVDIRYLATGIYFLQIFNQNELLTSSKVIKINL